jgi:hypothetical protein
LISIRGGSGLGDSIYVAAIARAFLKQSEQVEVCSAWPDVFRFLPVTVSPFRRERITNLAHYSSRKGLTGTTQFEDCCTAARIEADLILEWQPTETKLPRDKPIVCVQMPRAPMGRLDGFGKDLLPDCRRIQQAIDMLKGRAKIVQVGSGQPVFKFTGIDVDLSNRTTVAELIDVACVADAFLGYVSFIVPLAESLNKKALLVWSRKGLQSGHQYIRQITPAKALHKQSSRFVIDNCSEAELIESVNDLL